MGPFTYVALGGSLWSTVSVIVFVLLFYALGLGVYRLTFHPLSKFPGPKLSAFTGWYELYVDTFGGPRETFAYQIQRMHQDYGPIVRINPHELHVNDHEFFVKIYAGGGARRNKYPPSAGVQGTPDGIFGTVDHELHRRRRAAISGFFSRMSVLNHEDLIHEKVDLLCEVFKKAMFDGEPLNIRIPLLAFATDFYCAHALGEDGDMKLLQDQEKAQVWRHSIIGLLHVTPFVRQFPWIIPYALELPLWLIKLISADMALVVQVYWNIRQQAKVAINSFGSTQAKSAAPSNLMQAILSSNLPDSEKSYKRMAQEGFGVLTASGDTIARTLTTAIYHLIANPEYLGRLRDELDSVMPDPNASTHLKSLENLTWFPAVIKESLRISALITSRAVLQAPTEHLKYNDWIIPPNTPIGTTLADLMMDPHVFPEPKDFDPGRWLESDPLYARNVKYFLPFHRGHRNCIGMNLAWAEMYIALAKLFRRFDLELYGVVRERDIDHHRDCFLGEPTDDTKGVRVKILGLRE
ncbi:Trichodiene oxygenase [Colletotrichum gloeosporioides]|uniref:Trichodiene oxygenase n=1 Tax=Colletotrichum gloeosporioides TaxID=474922 RepID=A0A8H4CIJ1_COLGL|nr:Trichodiene oxygenase [Colletotrichum gloeosporioides]KAF3804593.1 Trichodiene oxygenase [Colletotrichum gloeosporioides]